MLRYLYILLVGLITSSYFFSFAFTFLPESINTKLILAVLGVIHFILLGSIKRELIFSKGLLFSALIALVFSVQCLMSAELNFSEDFSYASYLFTFFVWIFAAYSVALLIYRLHGGFTIRHLTYYLAGASVFQCISALVIDNNKAVKDLVDSVVFQGADFLEEIGRLYGVGASLDSAGVRFSVVLILIAFVIIYDTEVRNNWKALFYLISSFLIITVIGNMISRTTTTGALLGLFALFLSTGLLNFVIRARSKKMIIILIASLLAFTFLFVYLYQTDPYYYDLLRYGFEGFFNWVETGEWTTGSTEKLNAVMWVWPTDLRTWMIGSGIFGLFAFSTDIGYCRFVLYCGVLGFSTFVFLFIYNTYLFAKNYPTYKFMFVTLFVLALVIWLKVATDIFLIFALFYWLDEIQEEVSESEELITV